MAAALQACAEPPSVGPGSCTEPPDLEIRPARWVTEGTPLVVIEEQEQVALTRPPQGGHVLLVAAEVRGLLAPAAEIRSRLVDPDSGAIYAQEERVIIMVPAEGREGWMTPNPASRSQVNHVPVCPDYLERDLVGLRWRLEVTGRGLLDDGTQCGEQTGAVTIVPTCSQELPDERALCECECSAGYVLGACAP